MEESNNNENPKKGPKVEKVTVEKLTYSIDYTITKSEKEIDLDFDLPNPAEDRLFAYAVVLADLMYVLERAAERNSPDGFVRELQQTIKMIKSSLDANQIAVEAKHGVTNEKHKVLKELQSRYNSSEMLDKIKAELESELGLSNVDSAIQSVKITSEDISSDEKLEELARKILEDIPDNINVVNADFILGGDLPEETKKRFERILRRLLDEKKKHLSDNNSDDIEI
jgi:hypothetical protein